MFVKLFTIDFLVFIITITKSNVNNETIPKPRGKLSSRPPRYKAKVVKIKLNAKTTNSIIPINYKVKSTFKVNSSLFLFFRNTTNEWCKTDSNMRCSYTDLSKTNKSH